MKYLLHIVLFILMTAAVLFVELVFIFDVFEFKHRGLTVPIIALVPAIVFVTFFYKNGFMKINEKFEAPAQRIGRVVGVFLAIYVCYEGYWTLSDFSIRGESSFALAAPGFIFIGYSVGYISARSIFWIRDSFKQA